MFRPSSTQRIGQRLMKVNIMLADTPHYLPGSLLMHHRRPGCMKLLLNFECFSSAHFFSWCRKDARSTKIECQRRYNDRFWKRLLVDTIYYACSRGGGSEHDNLFFGFRCNWNIDVVTNFWSWFDPAWRFGPSTISLGRKLETNWRKWTLISDELSARRHAAAQSWNLTVSPTIHNGPSSFLHPTPISDWESLRYSWYCS